MPPFNVPKKSQSNEVVQELGPSSVTTETSHPGQSGALDAVVDETPQDQINHRNRSKETHNHSSYLGKKVNSTCKSSDSNLYSSATHPMLPTEKIAPSNIDTFSSNLSSENEILLSRPLISTSLKSRESETQRCHPSSNDGPISGTTSTVNSAVGQEVKINPPSNHDSVAALASRRKRKRIEDKSDRSSLESSQLSNPDDHRNLVYTNGTYCGNPSLGNASPSNSMNTRSSPPSQTGESRSIGFEQNGTPPTGLTDLQNHEETFFQKQSSPRIYDPEDSQDFDDMIFFAGGVARSESTFGLVSRSPSIEMSNKSNALRNPVLQLGTFRERSFLSSEVSPIGTEVQNRETWDKSKSPLTSNVEKPQDLFAQRLFPSPMNSIENKEKSPQHGQENANTTEIQRGNGISVQLSARRFRSCTAAPTSTISPNNESVWSLDEALANLQILSDINQSSSDSLSPYRANSPGNMADHGEVKASLSSISTPPRLFDAMNFDRSIYNNASNLQNELEERAADNLVSTAENTLESLGLGDNEADAESSKFDWIRDSIFQSSRFRPRTFTVPVANPTRDPHRSGATLFADSPTFGNTPAIFGSSSIHSSPSFSPFMQSMPSLEKSASPISKGGQHNMPPSPATPTPNRFHSASQHYHENATRFKTPTSGAFFDQGEGRPIDFLPSPSSVISSSSHTVGSRQTFLGGSPANVVGMRGSEIDPEPRQQEYLHALNYSTPEGLYLDRMFTPEPPTPKNLLLGMDSSGSSGLRSERLDALNSHNQVIAMQQQTNLGIEGKGVQMFCPSPAATSSQQMMQNLQQTFPSFPNSNLNCPRPAFRPGPQQTQHTAPHLQFPGAIHPLYSMDHSFGSSNAYSGEDFRDVSSMPVYPPNQGSFKQSHMPPNFNEAQQFPPWTPYFSNYSQTYNNITQGSAESSETTFDLSHPRYYPVSLFCV
jgi:hypothetical protein